MDSTEQRREELAARGEPEGTDLADAARPVRVAVLCLLPDSGHVIPLVRIASALQGAGHRVSCFLSDECAGLGEQQGVSVTRVGAVDSAGSREARRRLLFSSLGRKIGPVSFRDYVAWMQVAASGVLPGALAGLRAFAPEILITDAHIFIAWYERIAEMLGATLVYHFSEGSNRTWLDLYTKHNGLSRLPAAVQKLVGKLQQKLYTRTDALWRPSATLAQATSSMQEHIAGLLSLGRTSALPQRDRPRTGHAIATGLAVMEQRRLGVPPFPGVTFFGPVVPDPTGELPGELRRWIDAHAREPLVYLSFGTMVRLSGWQVRLLLDALDEAGLPALWSLPYSQRDALAGHHIPPRVRIEPHVPQLALLAAPQLAGVVTHGGSGTVQESLVAGKPLLCMPFFWDQYYNASVVEQLGAGRELRWTLLSASRIARALRALVEHEPLRRAAGVAAAELRSQRGRAAVVEHVVGVAHACTPSTGTA